MGRPSGISLPLFLRLEVSSTWVCCSCLITSTDRPEVWVVETGGGLSDKCTYMSGTFVQLMSCRDAILWTEIRDWKSESVKCNIIILKNHSIKLWTWIKITEPIPTFLIGSFVQLTNRNKLCLHLHRFRSSRLRRSRRRSRGRSYRCYRILCRHGSLRFKCGQGFSSCRHLVKDLQLYYEDL